MHTLAAGVSYFDLNFQDRAGIIATAVLHGPGGVAIVDPGPSSTLPVLERELAAGGISLADVTALLLTHIHLDHAGASGVLLERNPRLKIYVHEAGAPHMVDPSKLVASATRLYGDAMDRLWGAIKPVAAGALVALSGGDTIDPAGGGGRRLQVQYTPGHASHHVSYFDADSGLAFVGDTAGIRRGSGGYVLPPTPPPDIDLELWDRSLSIISAWQPDTLFLTHFGPSSPPTPHLAEMRDHLRFAASLVAESFALEGSDEAREIWFGERLRRELARHVGDAESRAYEAAGRFDLSWRGLARYLRKRG
jgi:glyoxylase-like metal-dependent hydrolase (beta-lactamase superfamily II)